MDSKEFDRHFDFLIHDIARLTRYTVDVMVASLGLTRAQWWLLTYLQRDEGKTQTELADELDVGKASMGALIDRMEKQGWIERRPHPTDRRTNTIHFTAKGRAVYSKVEKMGVAIRNEHFVGFTKKARESLIDDLILVKQHTAKAYQKALAKAARQKNGAGKRQRNGGNNL